MKIHFLFLAILFSAITLGQSRMVSKKVQELNSFQTNYREVDLFTKETEISKTTKYLASVSDITILKIKEDGLDKIMKQAPEYLTIKVPFQYKNLEVQLYKQKILTDDFYATDENGNTINYRPGQYYRGILKDNPNSVVSFSFFEDDVMGIISNNEDGNIVVGKTKDKQDIVTYTDKDLLGNSGFSCGVNELPENLEYMKNFRYDPNAAKPADETTEKCVRIYYEIANALYIQNGSNETATLNWITGIQNNISTLYNNDGINIALHSVMIWTTQDPYTGYYLDNLFNFRDNRQVFDGDLAHLVNYPSTTSVAFLDSLCGSYNYAYSGIDINYGQVPVFSWTIQAMTHEMGHSMGSPHTHDCVWNGNDTKIDRCGDNAGYPGENSDGDPCSTGGSIPSSGTIMSYCHLLPGVGIDFNNGFGDQPSALIRQTVDSKICLGSDCINGACFGIISNALPITKVVFAGISNSSQGGFNNPSIPGYEDFTNISGNVSIEETYPITVNGYAYSNTNDYVTVFIDWNQNGILDDSGEVYVLGKLSPKDSSGTISGNIEVPAGAVIGNTLMRVMLVSSYNDQPSLDPCGFYFNGQAEDYTLSIMPKTCYQPAASANGTLEVKDSKLGISSLDRDISGSDEWPEVRKGAWLVLEAKTKGFVPNRLNTEQRNALQSPIEGMLIYNTDVNSLQIYVDGSPGEWKSFNTQTCLE